MTDPAKTYELRIAVRAHSPAEGLQVKGALVAALTAMGRHDFVEGVVDGVETPLSCCEGMSPDEDQETVLAGAPVALFSYDRSELAVLAGLLTSRFGPVVDCRITEMSTESWQRAVDEESAVIESGSFVVTGEQSIHALPGKVHIRIRTGSAFGSGRHATTEVLLRVMENLAPADRRGSFFDVGTGTGILCIAAHHLGFAPITGTDIDGKILDEARLNLALNNVPAALRLEERPSAPDQSQDVVAANILAPVLHELLADFHRILRPGGILLLAGFIEKEAMPLLERAAGYGLHVVSRTDVRGWIGLAMRRSH